MPLPTCECVKGLPIGEQLAAIYCATYTLAAGDSDGPYLLKSANLSDVADPDVARGNISAAESGANSDIDSLAPVGGNLGVTGTITSSGAITASNANTGKVVLGSLTGSPNYAAIWLAESAGSPTASNYSIVGGNNGDLDVRAGVGKVLILSVGTNPIGFFDGSSFNLTSGVTFKVDKTITPGGTTGNQIINKIAGSVNFAAAAASLVVTNSLVTTNSVIQLTVAANDTTMKSASYVPANGSFTIFPDATPTAETRVDFFVFN